MCHEQFHRARVWDRETVEESERADESEADLPSYLADEEPREDVDLVTDGSGGE